MALSHRQKLAIIPVLLYWPVIFILAHIPLNGLGFEIQVSDKTLHYLAYLILVFLLWFAVDPFNKVNWRKAAVWWVLLVIVWYGVVDEWLQGYVGRNPDVRDFFADLAGALTALFLLTIFPFWPVSLILTSATIFVLTNFMNANLADQLPLINAAFHFFAYGLFTLLWTQYVCQLLPVKPPQSNWLIAAIVLPISFLLAVEVFSAVAADGFRFLDTIISLFAIVSVIAVIHLKALSH